MEENSETVGHDPTTFPLGGGCSIRLSYWDTQRGGMLTVGRAFVMPFAAWNRPAIH